MPRLEFRGRERVVLKKPDSGNVDMGARDYEVRWYEPADRDGLLALFEGASHWQRGGGREWFAWKYEENPVASRVPIVVATHEGAVVGARPFLPFRMAAAGETTVGLQTCDTVVHADHRRRGVFTEMTRRAFAHYADREPAFAFHLPNEVAREAYRSLGARDVGTVPTHYRIQRPPALLRDWDELPDSAALDLAMTAGAWTYLHAHDAVSPTADDLRVERHATVPVETMARLYRERIPERLHAVRDEAFYRWRFSNPDWAYRTFTAWRDGHPVAGLITGTRAEGQIVTYVTEVVPLSGGDDWRAAVAALLARALDFHDAVDLVAASGRVVPRDLLARFGFHADDSLPLSAASDPTVLLVSSLSPDAGSRSQWRVGDVDVTEAESWLLPFSEQDTA